jgi:ubiquinone/menaquinone biosynthesis C-methylase UbiE
VPDDRYSHGHHESVLRSHRWRTAANSAAYLLPHLRPTDRVADLGCGPGTITADLATLVPNGEVVGIDRAPEIVAAAAADHDAPNLSFEVGDLYHLGFDDGAFDVVHAHQVLQHLSDPVAALVEMRRVARTGGLVAVRDADYGAFEWSPTDPVLDRWLELYHRITRRNGAEADAGRHLEAWAAAAGFTTITASTSAWRYDTADDRRWWGELWADRVAHSEFATQALEYGLSDRDELDRIAAAFRRWSAGDGSFVVAHGEVLAVA